MNTELQSKIDQLTHAENDMKNILDSINTGIIFLDTHLRIKRFNAEATRVINLIPTDAGTSPGAHFLQPQVRNSLRGCRAGHRHAGPQGNGCGDQGRPSLSAADQPLPDHRERHLRRRDHLHGDHGGGGENRRKKARRIKALRPDEKARGTEKRTPQAGRGKSGHAAGEGSAPVSSAVRGEASASTSSRFTRSSSRCRTRR